MEILRAVAGRIIKKAACRNSQWSPAAAAATKTVVITSVVKCSMAIMRSLPRYNLGDGTLRTNPIMLKTNGLWQSDGGKSVGSGTRRGSADAHRPVEFGREEESR